MPNFVKNILSIQTSSNKRREEVLRSLQGDEENPYIDFENIVECPSEFYNEDIDIAPTLAVAMVKQMEGEPLKDEEQEELDNATEDSIQDAQPYIDLYNQYGALDWYEWRMKHWGSKWNADQQKMEGDNITFLTPWTVPEELYRQLSLLYPDCTFCVEYAEEFARECGTLQCRNGEVSKTEASNALAFLKKVWGEDLYADNTEAEEADITIMITPDGEIAQESSESYLKTKDYPQAIKCLRKELKQCNLEQEDMFEQKTLIYSGMALAYSAMDDRDEAYEYLSEAFENIEQHELSDSIIAADIYRRIAEAYLELDEPEESLRFYTMAIQLRESLGIKDEYTGIIYNDISDLYTEQGDLHLALEFALKAVSIFEMLKGEKHSYTATAYNNVSVLYRDLGDHQKALDYALKSLDPLVEFYGKDDMNSFYFYNNVGILYAHLKDIPNALKYEKMAYQICKRIDPEGENTKEVRNIVHVLSDIVSKQSSQSIFSYIINGVKRIFS